jgi:hypothetical protein
MFHNYIDLRLLPDVLIQKIADYIHNPQPQALQYDIISFVELKDHRVRPEYAHHYGNQLATIHMINDLWYYSLHLPQCRKKKSFNRMWGSLSPMNRNYFCSFFPLCIKYQYAISLIL